MWLVRLIGGCDNRLMFEEGHRLCDVFSPIRCSVDMIVCLWLNCIRSETWFDLTQSLHLTARLLLARSETKGYYIKNIPASGSRRIRLRYLLSFRNSIRNFMFRKRSENEKITGGRFPF